MGRKGLKNPRFLRIWEPRTVRDPVPDGWFNRLMRSLGPSHFRAQSFRPVEEW